MKDESIEPGSPGWLEQLVDDGGWDSLSDFASGFFLRVPHSRGLSIFAPSRRLRGMNGGVVDVSFSFFCSHSNLPANRSHDAQ